MRLIALLGALLLIAPACSDGDDGASLLTAADLGPEWAEAEPGLEAPVCAEDGTRCAMEATLLRRGADEAVLLYLIEPLPGQTMELEPLPCPGVGDGDGRTCNGTTWLADGDRYAGLQHAFVDDATVDDCELITRAQEATGFVTGMTC